MIRGRTVAAVAMAFGVLVLTVACAGPPPAQTYQTMAPTAPAPAGAGYETPPVLKASELAPAGLLSGPTFRVAPEVPTTGLLGEFAIQSDFGPLDPHGVDLLRIRVGEMGSLEQLSKMSNTTEFVKAAGRAAVRPVEATFNMVTHPVDTITGMPAGLDRLFDRVKLGGESIVAAATGTARSIPNKPNKFPPAITASNTKTGCKLMLAARMRGLSTAPSRSWDPANKPRTASSWPDAPNSAQPSRSAGSSPTTRLM